MFTFRSKQQHFITNIAQILTDFIFLEGLEGLGKKLNSNISKIYCQSNSKCLEKELWKMNRLIYHFKEDFQLEKFHSLNISLTRS